MDNLTLHLTNQPALLVVFIIATLLMLSSVPYFISHHKRYGSPFTFASKQRKVIFGASVLTVVGLLIYSQTPYITPPTDEIAIVLGNTQNTPSPKISGDLTTALESTMLQHKGDEVSDLVDSIKIISAVKDPKVISLSALGLDFEEIGNNNSNAKRSAKINVEALQDKINSLAPTDNGANYLEGILKAKDNVKEGSRIVVVGSGLSDSGDLNFSKSNLLTNEQSRLDIIGKIEEKYGNDSLETYSIEFYGLGDTVSPQESLPSKQKEIIRNVYRDVIIALGGKVSINTKTLVGESVKTNYLVGTTDTGCGDIGLVFDDNNLKFVGNKAIFTDESVARTSLASIKELWNEYSDTIQLIQVDGYIAHYPGVDSLSQPRAELVKSALIDLGVPAVKINATGRGFGPHDLDSQNRIVKITISRDSDVCEN